MATQRDRSGQLTRLMVAVAGATLVVSCDTDLKDIFHGDHHGGDGGVSQTCGGPGNVTCGPNQLCERPAGNCAPDAVGRCSSRPDICSQQYDPVCGCDGKTYGNDCTRAAAGVGRSHDGACTQTVEVGEGERCQGFTAPPLRVCKTGLFCMQLAGACGAADVGGICETTPTACTKEFNPVCGCDGKTYGNDCERRAASAPLDHAGACAL